MTANDPNELEALTNLIARYETNYEHILTLELQQRNRRAIELHGDLERALERIDALPEGCAPLRQSLTVLLGRILVDIFQINPDRVEGTYG